MVGFDREATRASRSRRLARSVLFAAVAALTGGGTGEAVGSSADGSTDSAFTNRWFSEDSPWNRPIPDDVATLPGSAGYLEAFRAIGGRINVNREIWTPTVAYAGDDVSRCDIQLGTWWLARAPMSPALRGMGDFFSRRGDTDASFCIYSAADKAFYNFWAVRTRETEQGRAFDAGAAAVYPIRSAGWWDNAKEPWAGRASGASYCGGLIRHSDLASGNIDHALALGWPADLVRAPRLAEAFVYPARTTDGRGSDPSRAVPMGARLQLDPTLTGEDLRALGLGEADLVLARALQRYGAYITDSSSVMAIYVESSPGLSNPLVASLSGRWPRRISRHFRFVAPPAATPLDDRFSVGNPTFRPAAATDPPSVAACLVD